MAIHMELHLFNLGVQNEGSEKTLANTRSRVSKNIGDFDCFKMSASFVIGEFMGTRSAVFRAAVMKGLFDWLLNLRTSLPVPVWGRGWSPLFLWLFSML